MPLHCPRCPAVRSSAHFSRSASCFACFSAAAAAATVLILRCPPPTEDHCHAHVSVSTSSRPLANPRGFGPHSGLWLKLRDGSGYIMVHDYEQPANKPEKYTPSFHPKAPSLPPSPTPKPCPPFSLPPDAQILH